MSKKDDVPQTDSDDTAVVKKKLSLKKRLSKWKPTRRNLDRSEKKLLRHADKFIISRWDNLRVVREQIAGWLIVMACLIIFAFIQIAVYSRNNSTSAPIGGGTYAEGVVGKIDTISPLYAATDREKAVSKLVYSGLFEYDQLGNLRPELASSYSISDDGKVYTVKLRPNVRWSDGTAFGADDVLATVNLMKNTIVDSVLNSSWKSVEAKKVNDQTVAFTLKSPLASFPFALTFGVLPNHIMKEVAPATVRSFSVEDIDKIVGTGPFTYSSSEALANGYRVIHFSANENYFRGKPRLAVLNIQTFENSDKLLEGFETKEVNAVAGLSISSAAKSLATKNNQLVQSPLADGVFALFNNSRPITGDQTVREALRLAIDRDALRKLVVSSGDNAAEKLTTPNALETPMISRSVKGLDILKQPGYDVKAAAEKLDAAGWKLNADKKREKDGTVMSLEIVTIKGADYEPAAKSIADAWRKLGIEVNLTSADPSSAQQNFFVTRSYDVLVYQIHLGADPDVYAYWGSSQANAYGLNLADYKSTISDLAMTNARSQMDQTKRDARYIDFAKRWIVDAPAIALYQPNFYYLKTTDSRSINDNLQMVDPTSRFSDVSSWTVKFGQVKNTP